MPEGRLGHDPPFTNKNAQNPPEFSVILDIVFLYTYFMPKDLHRASDFGHWLAVHLFYAQRAVRKGLPGVTSLKPHTPHRAFATSSNSHHTSLPIRVLPIGLRGVHHPSPLSHTISAFYHSKRLEVRPAFCTKSSPFMMKSTKYLPSSRALCLLLPSRIIWHKI